MFREMEVTLWTKAGNWRVGTHGSSFKKITRLIHCPWISGEEKKKGRGSSTAKTKERSMDRRSQETESPPDTKAAESCQGKKGAAKRQWPSSSEVEGRTCPGPDGTRGQEFGGGILMAGALGSLSRR